MKKSILLLAIPLLLVSCNGNKVSTSLSSSENNSSESSNNFASSFNPVSDASNDSSDNISKDDTKYETFDETLFNKLKTGGIIVEGDVNWEFSGQITDSYYGTTYDASEKVKVSKFLGQESSYLTSEVRYSSTSDTSTPDSTYAFKVFKNKEGYLSRLYLGADNLIHEILYTQEEVDEEGYTSQVPIAYDYYFGNPFKDLLFTDLVKSQNNKYTLTGSNLNSFGRSFLFFGETFDFEMSSASLYVQDGEIHVDIMSNRENYESSGIYNWLSGSLTISLAEEKDIERPKPYEEVSENAPLKNAIQELATALNGKGFTYNYLEKNGEEIYTQDITRMNSKGFVCTYLNNDSKVPQGIATYENGKNYFFEYRNSNIIKSGESDTLLLPDYASLSSAIFTKESENVYSVKTTLLARYAAEMIFDYYHKDAIDGALSSYSSSVQGTTGLTFTLQGGHISSITYNYKYFSKNITGCVTISDLNDTDLGYIFKTKNLGPVKKGNENFFGDFYSYDYGTLGAEIKISHLVIDGEGNYTFNGVKTSDTPLTVVDNKATIITDDGYSIELAYYPENSEFDLGYSSLTKRYVPVLFGYSKNNEHRYTFQLDPNSEANKDSGLLD